MTSTLDGTYAHHGRIRCYKITHPHPWFWEAKCDCGWKLCGFSAWPGAYWALIEHQTDLEPEWIVHPGWGAYWAERGPSPRLRVTYTRYNPDINPLDRCHNTTARRNQ